MDGYILLLRMCDLLNKPYIILLVMNEMLYIAPEQNKVCFSSIFFTLLHCSQLGSDVTAPFTSQDGNGSLTFKVKPESYIPLHGWFMV